MVVVVAVAAVVGVVVGVVVEEHRIWLHVHLHTDAAVVVADYCYY